MKIEISKDEILIIIDLLNQVNVKLNDANKLLILRDKLKKGLDNGNWYDRNNNNTVRNQHSIIL